MELHLIVSSKRMTSFLASSYKNTLPNNILYCKTSTSGYGSNFFNFFMCYLYAQNKKKILYLKDTKNNLSSDYHLILDTFQDLPGIQYTYHDGVTIQQLYPKELTTFYEGLGIEVLKKEAKRIFQLQPSVQTNVLSYRKGLPSFDLGIHIRSGDKITTGEMKAIPFQNYIDAIHRYQTLFHKQTLSIYVMTDSTNAFKEVQKKADSSWTLFNIPSPIQNPNGHVQSSYNQMPSKQKMAAFHHFLAELQILQQCPALLVTFSSNIGRFLRLTGTYEWIESLD